MQNLMIITLSFNCLEQNGFTKLKLYLSTIGWNMNLTRRLNEKMDYGLKEMNEMDHGLKKMNKMDYGLKEMNDTMTKAEWCRVEWWCHNGDWVLWYQ